MTLQHEQTTWALVPVKDFARAKSRLATVLTAGQCAELATCMTTDVFRALRECHRIGHLACFGAAEPRVRALAAEHGAEFIAELPGEGLLPGLDRAARQLQEAGARTLLIVPGDLPTITAADLDALLDAHRDGLTLCPARRDGGTNALIVSPPTGIGFLFGAQSCARHVRAAEAAGLAHRVVDAPAFRCDIDVPADLEWLCGTAPRGTTGSFLDRSGWCARFRDTPGGPPAAATA